jgi:hypothetical protein
LNAYNPIDVLVTNPYSVAIPLFLTFYSIYTGVRYFKTGKLSYSKYMSKESPFKFLASMFIFTGVLMTLLIFHEFTKEEYFGARMGILVDLLWLLCLIIFFYWYWHTKKEPFQIFHWNEEYLRDSKDKK